jgi:excisionase family DNA binding protein
VRNGENGLLKIMTAADRLAASRRYVYELRDRGLLEFVYLGPRMPRVRERDLAALVESGFAGEQSDIERLLSGEVTG